MTKRLSLFFAALVMGSVAFASSFERVTDVATLLAGGTFIIGYEKDAYSHKIVPLRNEGTATTTEQGILYAGMTEGKTKDDTLDLTKITELSDYEVEITASTVVEGAINILFNGSYVGNEDASNSVKLYSEEGVHTAFTPTLENNDVFMLVIAANEKNNTFQYNYAKPRFACYTGTQKNVVFYHKVDAAATVATPVFRPSMPDFAGSVSITLTCDTEDATIYYTLDGSTPTSASSVYSEPIVLEATTTVSAVAIKDSETSSIITREYTKHALSTCSSANASESNTLVFLDAFTVAYAYGERVYVQDATGSALLYGASVPEFSLAAGSLVQGLYGVCETRYIVPTCAASDLTVTQGTAPSPVVLNAAPTAEDINKYVRFSGVAAASATFSDDVETSVIVTLDGVQTTLRNAFGKTFTFNEGTVYDIVGVVSLDETDAVEVYFIDEWNGGASGVRSVSADASSRARKVFRNGRVHVVRDGVEHTLTGARVQ